MLIRFRHIFGLLCTVLTIHPTLLLAASPRRVAPASLDRYSRELFGVSMHSMDSFWDTTAHLVRTPELAEMHGHPQQYMVRETSWYAVGLLMRDARGDRQRAVECLEVVLKEQFLDRSKPWYGTFRRSPEEGNPPEEAVMWRDYDPNWREFIGTAFEMILIEYPDRIPADLAQRMYAAIDRAIEGEMKHGRLVPSYSNIALMYGALWDFAAAHDNNVEWKQESAAWIEEVSRLFYQHNSFNEYNSPTYYGVDLYGLALWRAYGSTPRIRHLGSEIETALWSDIAAFYHPDLRNIAGPYDRSYGMDMETYVALVGVWMRMLLPADRAPLPVTDAHTDHLPDLWFASMFTALGANPPDAALTQMRGFSGEHAVRRQITDDRTATAWIGRKVILGGQVTNLTKDAPADTQFHAATAQWRTPEGSIGWFHVLRAPKIDALVEKTSIRIAAKGDVVFRVKAAGAERAKITANKWSLPGLTVTVEGDQQGFEVKDGAYYRPGDCFDVTYAGMHHLTLTVTPQ
ncbi:MAG TPA: hypothetical protein VF214_04580 [Edaphobacter sp.]